MRLTARTRRSVAISLVSMVDVLMIMLVFFMVTSTYLDLDMIPVVAPAEGQTGDAADADAAGPPLMIRLGAAGDVRVGGRALSPAALDALLRDRIAADPATEVVVLPSPQADTQALVSVLDVATAAGVGRLRLLRLEPVP